MEERDTKDSILNRALILSYLKYKGEKTKSELAELLEVSRPTIYHHLEVLKRRGLIYSKKPNTEKKGAPVLLGVTKKAKPLPLKSLLKTKQMIDKIKKHTNINKK